MPFSDIKSLAAAQSLLDVALAPSGTKALPSPDTVLQQPINIDPVEPIPDVPLQPGDLGPVLPDIPSDSFGLIPPSTSTAHQMTEDEREVYYKATLGRLQAELGQLWRLPLAEQLNRQGRLQSDIDQILAWFARTGRSVQGEEVRRLEVQVAGLQSQLAQELPVNYAAIPVPSISDQKASLGQIFTRNRVLLGGAGLLAAAGFAYFYRRKPPKARRRRRR